MKYTQEKLGSFEVTSDTLLISDPCYDLNDSKDYQAKVGPALLGTWQAMAVYSDEGSWGRRVCMLIASPFEELLTRTAKMPEYNEIPDKKLKQIKSIIGVDSGQAGIFSIDKFKINYKEPYYQTGEKEHHLRSLESYQKSKIQFYEKRLKEDSRTKEDFLYKTFLETQLQSLKEESIQSDLCLEPITDWYDICCDITLSNKSAGVLNGGVVSSSGFGDGGYPAYINKNYDEINLVVIMFIPWWEDE